MRLRVVLAVFAVLAVLIVAGVYLAVQGLSGRLPIITTQGCTITGTVGGQSVQLRLEPEQVANAATIAAVGITRGLPARAVIVALAAAQQESKLYNLSGGDRDSLGLFQQRPSQGWGTPEQIADPRYAAGKFYSALVKVKSWADLPVEVAAQRVQKSADGQLYEQWADEAQVLSDAFAGTAPGALACTITGAPARRGNTAAQELAQGMALDWGRVEAVVNSGLLGVELSVSGDQAGWRYAHWLVAHAADRGVKSVRFGDRLWTASRGTWTRASAGTVASGGERVQAEVYAEH